MFPWKLDFCVSWIQTFCWICSLWSFLKNYLPVQFFCFSNYSLKLKRWIIPFFAPFEARIASIRPQKGIFCLPAKNPFSVKGFLIYAFLATFSLSQISQRTSIQVLAAVARNKGLASLPTRLHQVENISGRQLDGCLLLLLRILLVRINSPWKPCSFTYPSLLGALIKATNYLYKFNTQSCISTRGRNIIILKGRGRLSSECQLLLSLSLLL